MTSYEMQQLANYHIELAHEILRVSSSNPTSNFHIHIHGIAHALTALAFVAVAKLETES